MTSRSGSTTAMTSQPWWEREAGWDELNRHCEQCTRDGCQCKTFRNKFGSWAQAFPADPNQPGSQTWLWFKVSPNGQFGWTCLACDDAGDDGHIGICQKSNFRQHHTSVKHAEMTLKAFGARPDNEYTVPSVELFTELFKEFRAGVATTGGYDLLSGRVAHKKANVMLWCVHEADGDNKRQWLEESETLNILRDERHARLHGRVRGAGRANHQTYAGYLGQCRDFQPDALGLSEATAEIVKTACTSRAHCPRACAIEPYFNADLYDGIRHRVEAATIDSAENEVVSARDMSRSKPDGSPPDFPNMNTILRDAAHNARRVLSRLFKADHVLNYTMEFFMVMASIIQWSDDLRKLYRECVRESQHRAVETLFSHMRYAKHRIESWLTPLSRCCLDPEG